MALAEVFDEYLPRKVFQLQHRWTCSLERQAKRPCAELPRPASRFRPPMMAAIYHVPLTWSVIEDSYRMCHRYPVTGEFGRPDHE